MRFALIGVAAALHLSAAQPTQDCSHGPRRGEAIQLARAINTAQARARASPKEYQPLEGLAGITVPPGLTVQLIANEAAYIFTVKDEACGLGVFSDQRGLIYLGQTIK